MNDSQIAQYKLPYNHQIHQQHKYLQHSSRKKDISSLGWHQVGTADHLSPELLVSTPHVGGGVQQTFHFPPVDLDTVKSHTREGYVKRTESETINFVDTDYGHFVPLDQIQKIQFHSETVGISEYPRDKSSFYHNVPEQSSHHLPGVKDRPVTCSIYDIQQDKLIRNITELSRSAFSVTPDIEQALIPGI
jgi:hypothetical protein